MIRMVMLYLLLNLSLYPTLHSQSDEVLIEQAIKTLFAGMRANDSTLVQDLFVPGAQLNSIVISRDGDVVKKGSPAATLVSAIGRPRIQVWDEMIWSYDIKIDHPMAQAWTEYTFYLDDQLSHCGVNVFEMIHLEDGWKIGAITDTRRKTNCKTREESDINTILDGWHQAAATADEEVYFGSMTADAIYIGTDPSERWTTSEFIQWSKKYFEDESAWSFAPIERHVTVDQGGQIAWFDELLDTWMGICRGSGIMVITPQGWKIKHYHLAVAVDNDQIEGYLKQIGKL